MTTRFTCDFSSKTETMPHFWEHCVGSGHGTLALRSDWQAQLKQRGEELGFRHVRFYGVLDDDKNTVIDQSDELIYSFHNAGVSPGFISIHTYPADARSAGNDSLTALGFTGGGLK